MTRCGLICLLLGALAWGQAEQSTSNPTPTASSASSQWDASRNPTKNDLPSAEVRPDAPIITLNGLCEASHVGSANKNCVSVVTRAEFERMIAAIQPKMAAPARRSFATRYGELVAMAQKAHEMGLDQGQEFEQHMEVARLSILSEELNQALRERTQISDKDVLDYYRQNIATYEEADLQRMFVPRVQQLPTPKNKPSEAEAAARKQESENTMKAEAERLRARAVAGEDFNALQDEAFRLAGIHSGPSNTNLGKTRRSALPPDQIFVMDLKPGEVSAVIPDLSGYIIYRVGEKTTEPLDQVQDDIRNTLSAKRVQEQLQGLLETAKPVLDESYFGSQNIP